MALGALISATVAFSSGIGATQSQASHPRWQVDTSLVRATFDPKASFTCTPKGECLVQVRLSDGWNMVAFNSQGIDGFWRVNASPLPSHMSCPTESVCDGVIEDVNGGIDSALFKTIYSGRSWRREPLPGGITRDVGVSCPTPQDCLITGFRSAGSNAYSASTTNGGGAWSVTKLGSSFNGVYLGVDCPSTSTCYALAYGGRAQFIETTNFGASWSIIPFPLGQEGLTFYDASCWSASACAVAFEPVIHGGSTGVARYAVVKNGAIVAIHPIPGTDIFKLGLSCPTAEYCQASEFKYSSPDVTRAIETTDGGLRWSQVALPPGIPFASISCGKPDECAAVGYGHYGRATSVLLRYG